MFSRRYLETVGEEDRFRLGRDSNSTSVVVDCYLELALLVGRVALGLEAGRYFCALLRSESSPTTRLNEDTHAPLRA